MDDRDAEARIDSALVERAVRDGDPRVFDVLVRRHQGLVRAQLRRLLHDDASTADDLAQESFIIAWRKLDQFRGDSRFGTWLYRIVYSCFLQHLRSTNVRSGSASNVEADDPDAPCVEADAPELRLDLDAALRRLPENQRASLLYCVQLGLSHDEAASVLDMPLGTVKAHVARGKQRLRKMLKDWAPDHE